MSDTVPDQKPAIESSTFWGKVGLQVLVVLNQILEANGKHGVPISPELSALLAFGLEAMYQSWRHWNRKVINEGKIEMAVAKENAKGRAAQKKRR